MANGIAPPRRIALVVVHGVGDQLPGETAKAAANLLLTFPQPTANYLDFDNGCGVSIGVQPVHIEPTAPGPQPQPRGPFEERPAAILRMQRQQPEDLHRRWAAATDKDELVQKAKVARQRAHAMNEAAATLQLTLAERVDLGRAACEHANTADALAQQARTAAATAARLHFDYTFMRTALEFGEVTGSDCTYQSIRLTGRRHATAPSAPREVHIVEMYWADLSRLMPGVFQFLSEFYLLLFFVCQIGRKSIDAALTSHPNEFWWQCFRWCQAWSERLFTRFISVVNLYLLAIVVLLVPLSVPADTHPFIAVGVAAVLVIAAAFFLLNYRANPRGWPWVFVAGLLVAAALGAVVYWLLDTSSTYIAVLASWGAAVLMSLRLLNAFNQRQPGVFWVACVASGAITLLLIGFMPPRGQATEFIDAGLWTAEYVWAALAVLWILFGFFSFLTGITAVMTLLYAADRARTWRVVWTVAVSLALPPTIFLVLTLALWTALLQAGAQWLPHEQQHRLSLPLGWFLEKEGESVQCVITDLINRAAPPIYYVGIGLMLTLMAVVAWSLLPAALSESTRPAQINLTSSRWLGRCLSTGLGALLVVFTLIGILCLFGFPVVLIADYWLPWKHALNDGLAKYATLFLDLLALVIVAIVAAKGRLKALAPVMRSVLDIVLDVASWLRGLPRKRNPRSRICARYVSLLRYLCAWQDPRDHHGYDAIVIMAHSQGCVITADLLRFLYVENDPALARLTRPVAENGIRIHLFTMGNPLRQLYSWPLPDWYGWARDDRPQPVAAPLFRPDEQPEPDELLGVVRWINAYRSGDFVGRNIWRAESCAQLFDLTPPAKPDNDAADSREEFCIGNGAHTHYWDDTAPAIAARLDRLLAEA